MVDVSPKRIPGRWQEGFALDNHTVSSTYLGEDEFGHPIFDTKRSEIGELLYRLKYKSDQSVIAEIVEAAAAFIATWKPNIQIVVPVPASRARAVQPVMLLGDALAKRLGLPFVPDAIAKLREVPELKNVYDYNERYRLLAGAHAIDQAKVQARRVLLFDDLYRSGATMNAIAAALYNHGGVADVFALTITKTRSKS